MPVHGPEPRTLDAPKAARSRSPPDCQGIGEDRGGARSFRIVPIVGSGVLRRHGTLILWRRDRGPSGCGALVTVQDDFGSRAIVRPATSEVGGLHLFRSREVSSEALCLWRA